MSDNAEAEVQAWLTSLGAWARAEELPPEAVLAGLARHLVGRQRIYAPLLDARAATGGPPPPDGDPAELLGRAHEALIPADDRKARGVHYTPPRLADRLVALTLDGLDGSPRQWRVADLAAGGGAFLLAAARALVARGLRPADAARALRGIDLDPLAASVGVTAVALWSGGAPATVVVADGLARRPDEPYDAVVGNPPFQSQLHAATARPSSDGQGYTDTAGLFLARACHAVRARGRVGLIQPQSVLAARDAGPVRASVQERAALRAVWVAQRKVFDADTQVVAVVAQRSVPAGPVEVFRGPDLEPVGDADAPSPDTWAPLAARAWGIPRVDLPDGPTVASMAIATAGFRQQFYGLAGAVREGGPGPRLVTAGLIDPARCRWGERSTRFAGQRWQRPKVDLDAVEPAVRHWFAARLVPKVLVASQTRVIEAVVDEVGAWLPSVPVIAVEAAPDRLWDLAAALLAPPVSAWALGTGLSSDTLRVSAKLVLDIPLPTDPVAWSTATHALRAGDLAAYGRLACRAYGADEALADWWSSRLP
jgi:N-6 DNA Methylase